MIGKTVLVTGATNGIGLETAAVLAGMGAKVILVGRDAGRLDKAVTSVKARSGSKPASYLCDFASLGQVTQLADTLLKDLPRLDVLINNAGAVFARRRLTVDGLESTLAVNHLAPFLLTQRLLSLLTASAPSRILTVASGAHKRETTIDFDDLGFERGYQILKAYGRSKLCNVLFASELARRLEGTGVTSNSLTPGRVATNIWSGAPAWVRPLLTLWVRRSFMPVADGAAPVIALSSQPEFGDVSGQYFDRFTAAPASALAQDREIATRLWLETERLIAAAKERRQGMVTLP